MTNETQTEKRITFKDIYGNELIKVICEDCKGDFTALPHYNGKGLLLCIGCAFKRGLIK